MTARLRPVAIAGLLLLFAAALALMPSRAASFGTVYSSALNQNGEHERITRAALACPPGTPSDGTCFEPLSLTQLAGEPGTFGAVGTPDIPPPSPTQAHCDDADFLDASLYPRVATYPRSRADADRALTACRNEFVTRMRQSRTAAPALLDSSDRIVPAQVDLSSDCTFLGGFGGRAKCDVLDGFGRAVHGVGDFYAHTNWGDARVPAAAVTVRNPPGVGGTTIASFMDLRATAPPVDPLLISGCFSLYEKSLSPVDGCLVGPRKIPRVHHVDINKDAGTIDPVTGAATAPTTPRGATSGNFANAVRLAIADTRRQWADWRAEIILAQGSTPAGARRAALMICAMTRDNPVRDCQGRKLAIVVDSSGSNTTTDPDNLRIEAAAQFNASLVSAATAGPGGSPDRSAVIDFDDSARIVSPLADPSLARFDGIDSDGGTNIASGVNLAVDELTRDPADPTTNRAGIVVLTDGEDSDRAALIEAVDRATSLGARVNFGFLSPPANPVPSSPRMTMELDVAPARETQSSAPPADLVAAILASGGVYSTINSASAQRAFVNLVISRGATNLDDPNGADDGGPLVSGVGTSGLAGGPADTDTFSFAGTRGRVATMRVRALSGQRLTVAVRDIRGGQRMISARTGSDGTATIRSRLRRSRITEIDVQSRGTGGPYAIDLVEVGRDLIGNNRANRLRCRNVVTYVDGRAGNDRITCGSGDDMIVPGRGRDVASAGRGDDIVLVGLRDRHRGVETINGGPGVDIVEFEGGRRRTVRLARGRAVVVSGAARYKLSGIEAVLFGQKR
jgi:hypothetical protein